MKLKSMFAVAASLAFVGSSAFAEFSIDELIDVTKVAMTKFSTDHPDHVAHFVGYKSWKSGDDAKVKVYINHSGMSMEYNYICHKHDTGLECHDQ